MKRIWRVLRWPLLALVLAVGYAGYRLAFGTPFTINQLADRHLLVALLGDPELLTQVGLVDGGAFDRHSGKLTPVDVAERDRHYAELQRFRDELHRFERADLSPADRITWDVLDDQYGGDLAFQAFGYVGATGLYPFDPTDGVHLGVLDLLLTQHGLQTPKLARNYVRRLEAVGAKLDGAIAEMRRQAADGVVMPVALIDRSIEVAQRTVDTPPADSPLLRRLVDDATDTGLSADELRQLRIEAEAAVRDVVVPAFARIVAALQAVRPQALARPDDGIGSLPQGAALYALSLRRQTTTDLDADAIHRIGLDEVARLSTEIDAILTAQGIAGATIGERFEVLNTRADQLFPDDEAGREQLLARYREILAEVEGLMPQYFSVRPRDPVEVARVPVAIEAGAPAAYYMPAAVDGSRPGRFFANLRDVRETPRYSMKTLAYHEGVPGHHFQVDAALHLPGLPLIRQQTLYSAYAEGWALYAERLAAEIGLYRDDPLGDLGRLQAEMFRAVRLVVDTGLHSKGWPRAQAIEYMVQHTGMARSDVAAEIDRYLGDPGQACAYKIGQLKILELRDRARRELGDRFDLKAFHDVVLAEGAVPLDLLATFVDEWIARTRATPAPPAT